MDNDYEDYYPGYRQANSYNLLQSGWKPLYRHFDAEYFWQLAMRDPWALAEKFLDLTLPPPKGGGFLRSPQTNS